MLGIKLFISIEEIWKKYVFHIIMLILNYWLIEKGMLKNYSVNSYTDLLKKVER